MEKNIAILIADLSGYTALTETHGPGSAADLIDKYISMAENCLVDDTKLHQRTGDEILFVSDSPDALLSTALQLATHTANEENFLQVHGGLHYGKLLNRADSYFGTALNLTSRIAAKADAGSFYCSGEFINAISGKPACTFSSKGKHFFKNINGEMEVFEVAIQKAKVSHIDPVCRMLILNTHKAIHHPDKEELYFCSSQCLRLYKEKHQPFQAASCLN